MRVRLSADAREFLREEMRYLRRYSKPAAERLLRRIAEATENLSRFPEMAPELAGEPTPGVRRLVLDDYVLIYEIGAGGVAIVTIRHGRMRSDLPDTDPSDDYETGRTDV